MKHFLEKERIESELARVVGKEAQAQARANLFTLVIVCPASRTSSYAAMLDTLLGTRPSRIIYILTGSGGDTSASVSARCKLQGGKKSVCFEEITIANGRDNFGIDPRSWAPLLVADVPSYLLWLDRILPLSEPLVRGRELTDKLLVDSRVQEGMGEGLVELYSALSCIPETYFDGNCASHDEKAFLVSDFLWHATNEPRLVTAEVFDPTDKRHSLESIEKIEFESRERSCAFLYFVWLATRLGWTHATCKADTLSFADRIGNPVRCTYRQSLTALQAIRFTVKGGISCVLELLDRECVCTFMPKGDKESLLCSVRDSGSILLEQTDSLVIDNLFNDVVKFASGITIERI